MHPHRVHSYRSRPPRFNPFPYSITVSSPFAHICLCSIIWEPQWSTTVVEVASPNRNLWPTIDLVHNRTVTVSYARILIPSDLPRCRGRKHPCPHLSWQGVPNLWAILREPYPLIRTPRSELGHSHLPPLLESTSNKHLPLNIHAQPYLVQNHSSAATN